MELDGRPYWKPLDLAALRDIQLSCVHQLIEGGELEHRRVGECAIRIPACAVAGLCGEKAPVVSPTTDESAADLAECVDRFVERTGRRPEEFAVGWRAGRVADTAENARRDRGGRAERPLVSRPETWNVVGDAQGPGCRRAVEAARPDGAGGRSQARG